MRGSVDEVARHLRPIGGPDARLKKIDNFLLSRLGCCIVFQKVQEARLTLPVGDARPRLRRQEQGTTRKWRHKPLKSLKTDSQMANYRLAIDGAIDQANPEFTLAARRLPWRASLSANVGGLRGSALRASGTRRCGRRGNGETLA